VKRRGDNRFTVGAITLAVIGVLTFLGYTKDIPFTHGHRVNAVFESATSIRVGSPVRIAGVNVGKVTGIERYRDTETAQVSMELRDEALPLHRDATAKIRPRIFLEGNFFVDLTPGTPRSPVLRDGGTIPVTQTATPVQFDQVLTALQSDTRHELQQLLDGYGTALTYEPTARDDLTQDEVARGETAAESLNDAFDDGPAALRGTAVVSSALRGTSEHDLREALRGLTGVARGLARDQNRLADLVTVFDATMTAFATRESDLRRSVGLLAPTLRSASDAVSSLSAALPPTRVLAKALLPGVRETPATLEASFPWLEQVGGLLGPGELRGLAQDLRPAVASLSALVDRSALALPQADVLAQCATRVVLPTGNVKISDGPMTSGTEAYKEFWYALVGLAGESQNTDGNGQYVRFHAGGGDQVVRLGAVGGEPLFGKAVVRPLGTRPAVPAAAPPVVTDKPCKDQTVPDLNGARVGPPDGGAR
jgi:virulence factor Mce-like protein